MAKQFPATITIGLQSYLAATNGLRRERELLEGGWVTRARVSFWLPRQAFVDAGQSDPLSEERLIWNDTPYRVLGVSADPTNVNFIIECEEVAQ